MLLAGLSSIILIRTAIAGRSSRRRSESETWPAGNNAARTPKSLIVVLVGLTVLALSTRVFAGKILLISLGTRPWDQIFGVVQSSGRAFWAVGYALMIGAVAVLARHLSRPVLVGILAIAVGLQVADTAPLRAGVRTAFSERGEPMSPFQLPPGATLLTTLPVCPGSPASADIATSLRLAGVRAGLRLRDITFARSPKWFNCETALSDGLELPLLPKEVRVFLETAVTARLRMVALGRGTDCREVAGLVACTRDLPAIPGIPAPPGPALPAVTPPILLSREALAPLLSFGWRSDNDGVAWSEGPRATLLFRLAEPGARNGAIIHLQLEGVASNPGGQCPISVRLGTTRIVNFVLPDLQPSGVDIPAPGNFDSNGIVRLSLDINHYVDPTRRGLRAPVNRAGVRLLSVRVSRADLLQ